MNLFYWNKLNKSIEICGLLTFTELRALSSIKFPTFIMPYFSLFYLQMYVSLLDIPVYMDIGGKTPGPILPQLSEGTVCSSSEVLVVSSHPSLPVPLEDSPSRREKTFQTEQANSNLSSRLEQETLSFQPVQSGSNSSSDLVEISELPDVRRGTKRRWTEDEVIVFKKAFMDDIKKNQCLLESGYKKYRSN